MIRAKAIQDIMLTHQVHGRLDGHWEVLPHREGRGARGQDHLRSENPAEDRVAGEDREEAQSPEHGGGDHAAETLLADSLHGELSLDASKAVNK